MRPAAPSQSSQQTPVRKRQRTSGFFTPVRVELASVDRKPDDFASWVSSVKSKAFRALQENYAADWKFRRAVTATKGQQSPMENYQSADILKSAAKQVEQAHLVDTAYTISTSHSDSLEEVFSAREASPSDEQYPSNIQEPMSQAPQPGEQYSEKLNFNEIQKSVVSGPLSGERHWGNLESIEIQKHIDQTPSSNEQKSDDSYSEPTAKSDGKDSQSTHPSLDGHTNGFIYLKSNSTDANSEAGADSSVQVNGPSIDYLIGSAPELEEAVSSYVLKYPDVSMPSPNLAQESLLDLEPFEALEEVETSIAENAREDIEESEREMSSDEGPMFDVIHESHNLNADIEMAEDDSVKEDTFNLHDKAPSTEEEYRLREGSLPLVANDDDKIIFQTYVNSHTDLGSEDNARPAETWDVKPKSPDLLESASDSQFDISYGEHFVKRRSPDKSKQYVSESSVSGQTFGTRSTSVNSGPGPNQADNEKEPWYLKQNRTPDAKRGESGLDSRVLYEPDSDVVLNNHDSESDKMSDKDSNKDSVNDSVKDIDEVSQSVSTGDEMRSSHPEQSSPSRSLRRASQRIKEHKVEASESPYKASRSRTTNNGKVEKTTPPRKSNSKAKTRTKKNIKLGVEIRLGKVFLNRNLRKSKQSKKASQPILRLPLESSSSGSDNESEVAGVLKSRDRKADGQSNRGGQRSEYKIPFSSPWICSRCNCLFPEIYLKIRHILTSHVPSDVRETKCPFTGCRKTFEDKPKVITAHVQKEHSVKTLHPIFLQCSYCSRECTSGLQCVEHIATHLQLKAYSFACPLVGCDYKAQTARSVLRYHVFQIHANGIPLDKLKVAPQDAVSAPTASGSASQKHKSPSKSKNKRKTEGERRKGAGSEGYGLLSKH